MEGLGKKLQDARLARNLTLDEAGRMTKVRPSRLQDIENEDFSEFASLAYAKGFLLIYGKFLNVDVSPYLEAFETSESVTVDGYAYLQDNPAPKPSRVSVSRRPSRSGGGGGGGSRGSLVPLVIGVVVLVGGFMIMKWIAEINRLKPAPRQMIGVSPAPAAMQDTIVAPRAAPIEQSPSNRTPIPIAAASTPEPTVAQPAPSTPPVSAEPEVRRAEPVHPEDSTVVKPTSPPVVRRPVSQQVRATPPPKPRPAPTVPRAVPPQR
ncbi:MAG TPA: helix-turn-helix domain-containing protein [Pyrinomonadaceae bacterium]|jgi:cytoskeletal protein RodZ